ncbi:cation-transporting P-type ATPase [Olivibacter sitiensis]|uniref:cation-transporting P-type ATPase n=1 Tax=Olivibacter sitiensis TaxID=376470 RepID=UPI00040594B0|nr:cation-transporting P-type ATPase [Olivibacter sitiensis]
MSKSQTQTLKKWYALEQDVLLDQLEVNTSLGLSMEDVARRLEKFGPNRLPDKKKESKLIRFLKHFHDILIYILLFAAVITAFLGHYTDTIVIVVVAIVNACIGYFQENKAEEALESIKGMLSLKARVLRNGQVEEADADKITVGDIILLYPGDKIPADLRLIRADNLKIEESPLTGESISSSKEVGVLPEDASLGDRTNMAFTSTTVSSGTGRGVVVEVGRNTEIGKINEMMIGVEVLTTPLLRQTAKFGKTVAVFTIFLAVATYAFGFFFRSYDSDELLMSVIGLSVAAIPEGLPAILSIILAVGVQNMARRNAIIRNLPSVETLGSVSVICSDKTGTLTKNEMTVQHLVVNDIDYMVTGIGYAPTGEVFREGMLVESLISEPVLERLIRCFYECNEASLGQNEVGEWSVKGAPTEGALITLFHKSNLPHTKAPRKATLPFDSAYKYMAVLVEAEDHNIIYIKGAPDRLLDMADKEYSRQGIVGFERPFWEAKITELANKGQRIIGGGFKIVDKLTTSIDHSDIQSGVVFLGLAGIIDPPREEAIQAIGYCKEAGIVVKMITGDHADTAKAIGKQMGIGDGSRALQGKDLELMSDEDLRGAVAEYHVFARTSPEHKLRLVNALQANGTICAMTGDGVNDAPALKKADVGVAMGIKGTEVTKDASEMVLADDNFRTIVDAVEEGRRIYDNLKKTILFILPTNGAESFLIIASILFGTMMPLTPIQILWVNMVTSVTVSLALAFEPIEKDAMKRPPRIPNEALLSGYFIWRILFVSVLIGGGTLYLSLYLQDIGLSDDKVRTITLQTIVITQLFHLFNCRTIRGNAFNNDFFSNKAIYVVAALLFLLQFSITYIPFMNEVFGTVGLRVAEWRYPYYLGIIVFVVIEIEKAVARIIDRS